MARRLVRKSKKYPIFGLTGPLYMNSYGTRFKENVSDRYYCLSGNCRNRHFPDGSSSQFRSKPNMPDQEMADRTTSPFGTNWAAMAAMRINPTATSHAGQTKGIIAFWGRKPSSIASRPETMNLRIQAAVAVARH
ncbi:hypothetical protein MnTg02_01474 [bacterium MnTg02]|nr:hypothetical protein MnTg02_01474 [bacterium MnTg02]